MGLQVLIQSLLGRCPWHYSWEAKTVCLHLCVVETVNRSSQIDKSELAIDHSRGLQKGKKVGRVMRLSFFLHGAPILQIQMPLLSAYQPMVSLSLPYITSAFTHSHIIHNPYNSLTTTLTFSHNLTIIIFMPLHPHPCIQYIHRIWCLHAPTYINTPSHPIITPTQSHTVILCPKEV